jgi:hypothetical protein
VEPEKVQQEAASRLLDEAKDMNNPLALEQIKYLLQAISDDHLCILKSGKGSCQFNNEGGNQQ